MRTKCPEDVGANGGKIGSGPDSRRGIGGRGGRGRGVRGDHRSAGEWRGDTGRGVRALRDVTLAGADWPPSADGRAGGDRCVAPTFRAEKLLRDAVKARGGWQIECNQTLPGGSRRRSNLGRFVRNQSAQCRVISTTK